MPRPPTIRELLRRDEPLLIAHAGGNVDAPQQTMYAYRRAAAAGSDVLELDVMLTADGALIVHHDETVDRLTNGTGAVADLTLAQVRALDAAHWFVPGGATAHDRDPGEYVLRGVRTGDAEPPPGCTSDDFRVPTFREVAAGFPHLPLDVEVKGSGARAAAAVEVLAAELEALERVDSTVVVSFEAEIVGLMGTRLPAVPLSPGVDTLAAWVAGNGSLDGFPVIQIPPAHEGVDLLELMLGRAHAEGVAVWVWPDDLARETTAYYAQLLDAGVDGVIAASPSRWPRGGAR